MEAGLCFEQWEIDTGPFRRPTPKILSLPGLPHFFNMFGSDSGQACFRVVTETNQNRLKLKQVGDDDS